MIKVKTEEKPMQIALTEQPLLDNIVQATRIKPGEESYSITKKGVESLLGQLFTPGREAGRVSHSVINDLIAEIDRKISQQVDEILHHAEFQKLESAWRSLKFLVDRTDFQENIAIELLNVNKEDLLADFEDAPDITKSGLYKTAYSAEYGTYGGTPYGAIIGNYEFGPGAQDVRLMQYLASVASVSHSPFIGAAAPSFFGVDGYHELPQLKDLRSVLDGPKYAKWKGFRESADSRYVGLVLPRFMLRLPYGPETQPVKGFSYKENVSASHSPDTFGGNAAFAFATRLTDSFAKYLAGAPTSSDRWAAEQ